MKKIKTPQLKILEKYMGDLKISQKDFDVWYKSRLKDFTSKKETKDLDVFDSPELIYFWLHFYLKASWSKYDSITHPDQTIRNLNKDTEDLTFVANEFFSGKLEVRKIAVSIIRNKKEQTVNINASGLISRMLSAFTGDPFIIHEEGRKQHNSYKSDFLRSTKPLYNYLKDHQFRKQTPSDIFKYMVDFLESMDYEFNGSENSEPKHRQIKTAFTKKKE